MSELSFRVVIPARYASSRLPGKPLLPIHGRPMIQHVWERALEAGASEALVATDDERIARVVQGFGGQVVMTSPDHASGTDRIAEVVERAGWADSTLVVNLQGDEPQVPGALLRTLAASLAENAAAAMSTVATPIREPADIWNPNVVKVVLDAAGLALYFSRAPIPWLRGEFVAGQVPAQLPSGPPMLRHLGLYAYRVGTLKQLARSAVAETERAESLEQLRALHIGLRIAVIVVAQAPAHGVDTPQDLARVEADLGVR
jgi:3-deoxy-manno-octulosonate cytidylyltransferase (CMP-KDO synthetase)